MSERVVYVCDFCGSEDKVLRATISRHGRELDLSWSHSSASGPLHMCNLCRGQFETVGHR